MLLVMKCLLPDMTLSMGIAYTAQAGNLEITPRLDYYYRSDSYNTIYNIEATKTPAWDEMELLFKYCSYRCRLEYQILGSKLN